MCVCVRARVRVVCVCVRACVRVVCACQCACVRACVRACVCCVKEKNNDSGRGGGGGGGGNLPAADNYFSHFADFMYQRFFHQQVSRPPCTHHSLGGARICTDTAQGRAKKGKSTFCTLEHVNSNCRVMLP